MSATVATADRVIAPPAALKSPRKDAVRPASLALTVPVAAGPTGRATESKARSTKIQSSTAPAPRASTVPRMPAMASGPIAASPPVILIVASKASPARVTVPSRAIVAAPAGVASSRRAPRNSMRSTGADTAAPSPASSRSSAPSERRPSGPTAARSTRPLAMTSRKRPLIASPGV